MAVEQVSAKLSDMEESVTVEYDFGDNLADAVEKYGEETVFSRWVAAARIDLQAYMRGLIKQKKTPEEIAEAVENWQPGVKVARSKSAAEKLETLLSKLSEEERAALFQKYLGGGQEAAG